MEEKLSHKHKECEEKQKAIEGKEAEIEAHVASHTELSGKYDDSCAHGKNLQVELDAKNTLLTQRESAFET